MDEEKAERQASLRPVVPDEWNRLTESILSCAYEVHTALGPGLTEAIYEAALVHELRRRGIRVEQQVPVQIRYKDLKLPPLRLDLLVEGLVIIELKALEAVPDVMLAKLVSYLRAADAPLGLLINFNVLQLKSGIYRRINPWASAALPHRRPLRDSAPTLHPLR
jgi:GxxExxY protein